jgi:GT2 family glycosyltransferase
MLRPAVSATILPVSVVVPTIGRVEQLRVCVGSLVRCDPRADEVLVADQSADPAVAELVAGFADAGVSLLRCDGRGPAAGRNAGLRAARNAIVAMTDDDCAVAPDWIGTAWRLMEEDPHRMVTGRVLAAGDPRSVPSTNEQTTRRDFTGLAHHTALFSGNMVVGRDRALAYGGFDERFGADYGGEDNDLCYRWLRAGERLLFEPDLVVEHRDWRTPAELALQYRRYMRGEGFFYAKHLRAGDVRMLRYLARDVVWALRGLAAAVLKPRDEWPDPRRAIVRGLPAGLYQGVRVFWLARPAQRGATLGADGPDF